MNTIEISPEKSLQIISEMIEKSRKDFEKNSGTPMIVWGTVVCAVSVVIGWLLISSGNQYWNFLWFSIPAIGYPVYYFFCRKNEEKRARSLINDLTGVLWASYGLISVLIALIACFIFKEAIGYISPMVILLLGFSSMLTGLFVKNYSIAAGGLITAIAGSILSIALSPVYMPFVIGGAAMVSLLVPGIVLTLKK